MNQIKRAKMLFVLSSIISIVLAFYSFYKIYSISKEQELLNYMPMGDYKIVSEKEEVENEKTIVHYKVIANRDNTHSDFVAIIESVVENSKNTKKREGIIVSLYANPNDVRENILIQKIIYSPYATYDDIINNESKRYEDYKYTYEYDSLNPVNVDLD